MAMLNSQMDPDGKAFNFSLLKGLNHVEAPKYVITCLVFYPQ